MARKILILVFMVLLIIGHIVPYAMAEDMPKAQVQAETKVEAEKEAQELKAVGEAARIAEDGRATAEAVRVLREQREKEDTRELFLI